MAKVPIPNTNYDYDEDLSFKDFTNREFISRPEYKLDNKVIYASCFSQEIPDSDIFGKIFGVVFINCNLDNVIIPEGNPMIDCSHRRFLVQNDGNDWEVDGENEPVTPLGAKIFTKLGLQIPNPSEIPSNKVDRRIDWVEVKNYQKIVDSEIK